MRRLGKDDDGSINNEDDPLSSLLIPAVTKTEELHGTMIRKRAGHVSSASCCENGDGMPLEEDASEGHRDPRVAASSSSSFPCSALHLTTAMSIYMREPMNDLLSGLVVGLLIVPQSMSYAKLAGLPVEYGLYSSLVPLYTYALSYAMRDPHSILAVGPVALVSLLLSSGLHSVMTRRQVAPNSNEYAALYAQLATQTSILVGILYILLGSLRWRRGKDTVANAVLSWLSPTVISGFSSGAAVLIAASQCKYFLGYAIPPSDTLPAIVLALLQGIHQFHGSTFVVGITALMVLVVSKKSSLCGGSNRIAVLMPLFLTIGAVLGTYMEWLPTLPIVGTIPSGWPASSLPTLSLLRNVRDLFPVALGIVVIGFMETMAIAQQLAAQAPSVAGGSGGNTRRTVNASQELMALGLANLCGGLVQAYPVAGSFSRSAIQRASGAQTRAAGAVTATVVAVALLWGTRFFEQLPYCVLAAIVVAGVLSLLDISEAKRLWKAHPSDFSVWCLAFGGTLLLGCEYGLFLALSCSWLLLLYQVTHVPVTWLGQMPDAIHDFRDRQVYPSAQPIPGIVMIRWNGPINFLNIRSFERAIQESVPSDSSADDEEEAAAILSPIDPIDDLSDRPVMTGFVLDMRCVTSMDSTALRRLDALVSGELHPSHTFCWAHVSPDLLDVWTRTGFLERIGADHIFDSLSDAVEYCRPDRTKMDSSASQS